MLLEFDITDNIKNMTSRLLVWASLGMMNIVPWLDMDVFNEDLKSAVNALLFIIGWVISMFIAISTILKRKSERKKIEAETESIRIENMKKEAEAQEQALSAQMISATHLFKRTPLADSPEVQEELKKAFNKFKDDWVREAFNKKIKTMYKPDKIIVHCTYTRTDQSFSIEDIRDWHVNPKVNRDGSVNYKGKKYSSINDLPEEVRKLKGNGWSDVGYHIYFRLDGSIEYGRSIYDNGAHCKGKNKQLGAAFEGGMKPDGTKWDNFTEPQIKAFRWWKETIERIFGYELSVHGHNEFSSKTCPNASVEILK